MWWKQGLALDSLATWLTEDGRLQPKLAHRDTLTRITALLAMHSPARAPRLSPLSLQLLQQVSDCFDAHILCAFIAKGSEGGEERRAPTGCTASLNRPLPEYVFVCRVDWGHWAVVDEVAAYMERVGEQVLILRRNR